MASVERFVSVYLRLLSILSLSTATPRPPTNQITITKNNPQPNPPFPPPIHLTHTTHAKRARPPVGTWGEQYALSHGWSVTVSTMSIFMSFGSQSAANWFDTFYRYVQIASVTRMLNNSPYLQQVVVVGGPWKLVLAMHPDSTAQEIEWSFVYDFATYMLNWVVHGYTGSGAMMFKHTSGIKLVAWFVNMEGRVGSVVY